MSADNWAECPRCRARQQRAVDVMRVEVEAAYGKVSAEDFEALRGRLADAHTKKPSATLREDYEIYGAADGVVKVSYGCSCSECGLQSQFDYDHVLEVQE